MKDGEAGPPPASPPPAPAARTETPGAAGELITDLRRAAGYLGAAVDVLRRRQPELEALLAERDEHVPF